MTAVRFHGGPLDGKAIADSKEWEKRFFTHKPTDSLYVAWWRERGRIPGHTTTFVVCAHFQHVPDAQTRTKDSKEQKS